MNVSHGDHSHDVTLGDDGTLDTVITVDGRDARYSEADRDASGAVKASWLRSAARDLCDAGELDEEPGRNGEPGISSEPGVEGLESA
jgi:hypothetical protein